MDYKKQRTVHLSRDRVVLDVEREFQHDNVTTSRIAVTVDGEQAADFDGGFRNISTAYWNDVFGGATFNGDGQAAPQPHPTASTQYWAVMGNFIMAGYRQNGYLPIRFALACLIWAIFGHVDDDIQLESWLMSLGPNGRFVMRNALRDGVSSSNRCRLIDILNPFRNNQTPSTSNPSDICVNLARCFLIENAMWPLLNMGLYRLRGEFTGPDSVCEAYHRLRPTNDNVVEMLSTIDPMTSQDVANTQRRVEVFEYLQQFIRNLSPTSGSFRVVTR